MREGVEAHDRTVFYLRDAAAAVAAAAAGVAAMMQRARTGRFPVERSAASMNAPKDRPAL